MQQKGTKTKRFIEKFRSYSCKNKRLYKVNEMEKDGKNVLNSKNKIIIFISKTKRGVYAWN